MTRLFTDDQEFWRRVDVREMSECWRWQGTQQGCHGAFDVNETGEQVRAHRYAWSFAYGPIPTGMLVLHCCDNSWCVNPRHLRLGTHEDNNKDKSVLSRVRQVLAAAERVERERNERAQSLLGPAPAPTPTTFGKAILRLRKSLGLTQREFAAAIGVTNGMVCHWEKGVSGTTIARVNEIARRFGVDVRELLS